MEFYKHYIVFAIFSLFQFKVTSACNCIGNERQTTETAYRFSSIVVQGKIIATKEYIYVDTFTYNVLGKEITPGVISAYSIKMKLYTLVIDHKFKHQLNIRDTIQILTGLGGGDCGFPFELGRDYIIYADHWKEKAVKIRRNRKKVVRSVILNTVQNVYFTGICDRTQLATPREFEKLRQISQ